MLYFSEEIKRFFTEQHELKMTFAIVAIMFSWVFNGEYQAAIAIFSLVTLDFITGTHHAIKSKTWSSHKSSQGIMKYFRYLAYMFVGRMVDKVVPIPFFAPLMDSYIVINEAGSILENFDKMGYNVPSFLLEKLKNFFKKE